jgi:hypothetical protein
VGFPALSMLGVLEKKNDHKIFCNNNRSYEMIVGKLK